MNARLQRTRIVSFRASPEEYSALQKRSISQGARSVSEFARLATCGDGPEKTGVPDAAKLDALLANLNETVAALEAKIEHLTRLLAGKND